MCFMDNGSEVLLPYEAGCGYGQRDSSLARLCVNSPAFLLFSVFGSMNKL